MHDNRRFVLLGVILDLQAVLTRLVDGQAWPVVQFARGQYLVWPLITIVSIAVDELDIVHLKRASMRFPILAAAKALLCLFDDLIVIREIGIVSLGHVRTSTRQRGLNAAWSASNRSALWPHPAWQTGAS